MVWPKLFKERKKAQVAPYQAPRWKPFFKTSAKGNSWEIRHRLEIRLALPPSGVSWVGRMPERADPRKIADTEPVNVEVRRADGRGNGLIVSCLSLQSA